MTGLLLLLLLLQVAQAASRAARGGQLNTKGRQGIRTIRQGSERLVAEVMWVWRAILLGAGCWVLGFSCSVGLS